MPGDPRQQDDVNDRDLHALLFDPFSETFRADPYPVYRRLRKERPLFWHPAGFWIATRYAACDEVLRSRSFHPVDPQEWQSEGRAPAAPEAASFVKEFVRRTMLFAPAADHARYRGPLNRAFAPRVMEAKRARIRRVARDLVAAFPRGRPFDFMETFASPFPILMIADLLGVPPEDQPLYATWSATISPILDPVKRGPAMEAAARSMKAFDAYTRDLLRQRERAPQDDLLSLMQEPDEEGTQLTEDELVSNVGFLIAAAHGTAKHLFGTGLYCLLREPGLWEDLRRHRDILPTAIEEMLRFESPAQMTIREAVQDVFVGNRLVQKGRRIVVLLGSANRDPEVFPDPDRFDPRRFPNEHLAFSGGAHYCLGAALARIEGQEVFDALADEHPSLRLAAPATEWQSTITMRGLSRLPVVVDPA